MTDTLWRVEDYFDLNMIDDVVVSHDQSLLAVEVRSAPHDAPRFVPSIVVLDSDGTVLHTISQATRPRWSPTAQSLSYLDLSGEYGVATVHPLGEGPSAIAADLPAEAAEWTAAGDGLLILRVHPAQQDPLYIDTVRHRYDGLPSDRHFAPRELCLVDLATGTVHGLLPGHDALSVTAGPEGRFAAAVRRVEACELDHFVDIHVGTASVGSATRSSVAVSSLRVVEQMRFSPDGEQLAYIRQYGEDFGTDTCVEVVQLAQGTRTVVLEEVQAAHGMRSSVLWLDNERLLASKQHHGAHLLLDIPLTSPDEASTVLSGDVHLSAIATGTGTVWLSAWWVGQLPRVMRLPLTRTEPALPGDLIPVYDPNATLRSGRTAHGSSRLRLEAGGSSFESFVIEPAVPNGETIISIHGGPHLMHPMPEHRVWFETQLLASAGYRVVLPNPIGSSSYGVDFNAATKKGEWGKADAEQFLALAEHFSATASGTNGVHVIGYSYGGYMGLLLGTRSTRFSSIVSGGCVSNLVSMYGTSDVPGFVVAEMGGTPEQVPQRYLEASPVMHASKLKTPTLFLHQAGDLRCPLSQAEEMFVAIRANGVESALQVYPGGAHTIATPAQFRDRISDTLDWVRAHPLP